MYKKTVLRNWSTALVPLLMPNIQTLLERSLQHTRRLLNDVDSKSCDLYSNVVINSGWIASESTTIEILPYTLLSNFLFECCTKKCNLRLSRGYVILLVVISIQNKERNLGGCFFILFVIIIIVPLVISYWNLSNKVEFHILSLFK